MVIFQNWIKIVNKIKQIKLTQGKFALVDAADFNWLNSFKWHAHKTRNNFYVARRDPDFVIPKLIFMHRMILGLQRGNSKVAHHINHNTLDNRRCNLKKCTHSENLRNREPIIVQWINIIQS